ncbi:MAG: hypothetical protein WD097_06910 [Balneolales bacterium]
MKATRFSMTLYISLPVLASACSVVMIAHFVLLVEGRILADGPYGDTFTYIALAESFGFFNSELITFRIISPLISGTIANLFTLSGQDSLGLLTGSLNFVYLLLGFSWMYYLAMKELSANSLEVALPTFLILMLPGFWKGIFFPVPDALMFCMFGLILAGILRQQLAILLPAILVGVWVSEWLFLSFFLMPMADWLRGKEWNSVWTRGYIAFAAAAVGYLAVPLFTQIPETHMIYHPDAWLTHIGEQFANRDTSFIRAFWRSFTMTLFFIAYRFYVAGWNRVTGTLSIWFIFIFVLVYLLAPDSANRIMFMTMPALVLWQYRVPTFRNMDLPLKLANPQIQP